MTQAAFLLLTATPAWLALTPAERQRIVSDHLEPVFLRHHDVVRARYFDLEAYSARPSDMMMLEFDEPGDHAQLVDELRNTPIFSKPYFVLEDLIVGEQARWIEPN